MAKPKLKYVFAPILIFGLGAMVFIAKQLNWYTFYTLPTVGMDPTYKAKDFLVATCLTDFKKGDAVSYWGDPLSYEETKESYVMLGRIVAEENDVLQIKKGSLYINGKLADDTMNLGYFFTCSDLNFKPSDYDLENKVFNNDTMKIFNFSYKELKDYGVLSKCKRLFDTSPLQYSFFRPPDNEIWTSDDFGPITIPKNFVFIMGDNRSNSADSRYRGYIDRNKLVAKILN